MKGVAHCVGTWNLRDFCGWCIMGFGATMGGLSGLHEVRELFAL